jgi:hypothetical protein
MAGKSRHGRVTSTGELNEATAGAYRNSSCIRLHDMRREGGGAARSRGVGGFRPKKILFDEIAKAKSRISNLQGRLPSVQTAPFRKRGGARAELAWSNPGVLDCPSGGIALGPLDSGGTESTWCGSTSIANLKHQDRRQRWRGLLRPYRPGRLRVARSSLRRFMPHPESVTGGYPKLLASEAARFP